jgi:hypothetical protein
VGIPQGYQRATDTRSNRMAAPVVRGSRGNSWFPREPLLDGVVARQAFQDPPSVGVWEVVSLAVHLRWNAVALRSEALDEEAAEEEHGADGEERERARDRAEEGQVVEEQLRERQAEQGESREA